MGSKMGSKMNRADIEEFNALGRVLSCLAEEGLITENEYREIVDNTELQQRQASIYRMMTTRTSPDALALLKLIKGIYPVGDTNSSDE